MYARKEPEPLEELLKCREVPESDLAVVRSVVSAFLELGETSRKEVIKFVESCAEKLNAPTDDVPGTDAALAEIIVWPLGLDFPEHIVETLESLILRRLAKSRFFIPSASRIRLIRSATVSIQITSYYKVYTIKPDRSRKNLDNLKNKS